MKYLAVLFYSLSTLAHNLCAEQFFAGSSPKTYPLSYSLDGLQIGSLADATQSTGATVFYFPKGAAVNFDARGGAVAAVETTLLSEGSYSNLVDAILFAGGSTMGLAAADGVREVLFKQKLKDVQFDFIPSVPGAVIYDFSARIFPFNDPNIYPSNALGQALMKSLTNVFEMGRAGAGISATANKVGTRVWGGQGAAFGEYSFGKIFVAVILNAVGDIQKNGKSIAAQFPGIDPKPLPINPRGNTTLSLIVTDAALDRNQLKRLSTMVHTSMAQMITPFHTSVDGDINFAASTRRLALTGEDAEFSLQVTAGTLMETAIENAIRSANTK